MKKTKILLAMIVVMAMLLSACSNTDNSSTQEDSSSSKTESASESSTDGETLTVVTTTFSAYDWIKQIVGDTTNIEVSLLIDSGVDIHSYQPTTSDIAEIANADLVVYNGGDSDTWVADAIEDESKALNLVESIPDLVKTEETVEGMQESEHAHDHDEEESHDHDEETSGHADEHIWLSIENAEELTKIISARLQEIDTENASTYEENATAYVAELETLDQKFETELDAVPNNTLLFADRFPFRYLVDDYDISYYAAFPGCSAETEASFETIVFLSDKINELALEKVIIIDNADDSIARTVIDSSDYKDAEILTLNSLQSVTADDIANGASYISLMEENLAVLVAALS